MGYRTIDPSTGKVVQNFDSISDSALAQAVDAAQACYETDWRRRSIGQRAAIILAAADLLRRNVDHLAGLATLEMGKLIEESRSEVRLCADIFDYYASHAEAFLAPRPIPNDPNSVIETFPLGIILGVEPWNFPYYQLARVVAPQLAVGNVLIIKHASNVPQAALAFARILEEAGAPKGAYTNIFASTDQIARLIDDFRIRGVTLTGSEGAGSAVAERAGRALKKSVLELGGSDPLVILEDAPFDATLDNVVWGRMNTAGQSCTASKRVIVVGKARGAQFLEALRQRLSSLSVGDPADPATTLGPVSSDNVLNGLLKQIESAKVAGATVVIGGSRIGRPGFYLEPTILTDITAGNPVYTQELFGPVLSFYVVESEEEAIAVANATPFGLGASVFTANLEHGKDVARRIESGMVYVNRPVWSAPELPFGGVKLSGYGRELSELGIGEFVNRKLINVSAAGSPPPSSHLS
ncbi:succinate-semialdehyde dehydrogenase [Burkholderia cepacia]|nr:succinate-semialdehyde dehydrogenase [Burkholderia cepacia]